MTATLRMADLRAATARILNAVERRFGPEIDLGSLPFGYRWGLDPREIFKAADPPVATMLGDLSEDLEEILDLVQRPEEETFVWHDLSHLIGLLQLLVALDLPPESATGP